MSRKCTRFVCFLLFFYKWTDKEVELSLRITLQDCKVAKAGENVVLVFQRRIAIASGQPFEKMQSEGRTKVTLIFNNALNPDSRQHNNCSTTSHASLFVLTWPRHVTINMSQFLSISVFSAHTTTRKLCVFLFFLFIHMGERLCKKLRFDWTKISSQSGRKAKTWRKSCVFWFILTHVDVAYVILSRLSHTLIPVIELEVYMQGASAVLRVTALLSHSHPHTSINSATLTN